MVVVSILGSVLGRWDNITLRAYPGPHRRFIFLYDINACGIILKVVEPLGVGTWIAEAANGAGLCGLFLPLLLTSVPAL